MCLKEGFLLGNGTKVTTNTVSDADLRVVKHQIVYSKFMFYYGGMIHICKCCYLYICALSQKKQQYLWLAITSTNIELF